MISGRRATGRSRVFFPVLPGQDPEALAEALRKQLQQRVTRSPRADLTPAVGAPSTPLAAPQISASPFTYFSFFIVVAALLLVVLFFRLGIEQRLRQIGVLRATGYTGRDLRWMLSSEAAVLALAGGLAGSPEPSVMRAPSFTAGRTWWVGAVGTTLLELHVTVTSLLIGFAGGLIAALACVLISLRAVARRSPRALLGAHSIEEPAAADPQRARRRSRIGAMLVVAGFALLTLGFVSPAAQAGAFFGASAALLGIPLLSPPG